MLPQWRPRSASIGPDHTEHMGSSLQDIPGAGGGRRRRGPSSGRGRSGATQPWTPAPRRTAGSGRVPRISLPRFTPRADVDRFNLLLGLAFAVVFVIGGVWLWRANAVDLSIRGIEDDGAVPSSQVEALKIDLVVDPPDRIEGATVRLDGEDITDEFEVAGETLSWSPGSLDEGQYELSLKVPRGVAGSAARTFHFAIDDTDPEIEVPAVDAAGIDDAIEVKGTVDEAVTVTGGGAEVVVDEAGPFTIAFDVPPAGGLTLVATDKAGNSTDVEVAVPVAYPAAHAVYVRADQWVDEGIRAATLDLLGTDAVDAVVLDVKDDCGEVVAETAVPFAATIGARTERFDLAAAAEAVHEKGGRLIARVVTFVDPMLARWAWENGRQDLVVRDTAAVAWAGGVADRCTADNAPPLGGGYTNFAAPEVWTYNRDLAVEAAAAGADDVLLDEVRRPEGDLANMNFDGVQGTVEETLARFLGGVQSSMREENAYLGVSVLGLSVRDPTVYGQDLAQFALSVDFVAPEVYPESYSTGFFNLEEPVAQPGKAVAGAVDEAAEKLGDVNVAIVPWIQDYSGPVPYGVPQVQAQVSGAERSGACGYIRFDPEATYSPDVTPVC